MKEKATERHPFEPFLPEGARVLLLGSFPPGRQRWCMDFYYPNWINDFWRIMGLIFHSDRDFFTVPGEKRFDRERIEALCRTQGLAMYDTAAEVCRLRDNASDKYLEIIRRTDIPALLARLPRCAAMVTTGEKASEVVAETFSCTVPRQGEFTEIRCGVRTLRFWRMPSTSRAYPLPLDRKADAYRKMLTDAGIAV